MRRLFVRVHYCVHASNLTSKFFIFLANFASRGQISNLTSGGKFCLERSNLKNHFWPPNFKFDLLQKTGSRVHHTKNHNKQNLPCVDTKVKFDAKSWPNFCQILLGKICPSGVKFGKNKFDAWTQYLEVEKSHDGPEVIEIRDFFPPNHKRAFFIFFVTHEGSRNRGLQRVIRSQASLKK